MAGSRLRTFIWNGHAQFRLALPIMGAQLAQTGMALVDTLMTGHYAATDLAAVSVGSSLWLPLYLLIAGVLMAVTPHVARAYGGRRYQGLAAYLQSALWLALALGVLGAVLLALATPLFWLMGVEQAVAERGQAYLLGVAVGFPAIAVYHVLRGLSEGMYLVKPVLVIGLLGLAVNVPANYLLIYGGLGIPGMGALGCGIATALSMWVMAAGMGWCVARHPRFRDVAPFGRRHALNWSHVRETLFVGVPIGLAIFFEVSLFAAIALLVAGLGTTVVAAHQIALNFTALLFMVPLSMGMALTVRVGDALGRDDAPLARQRSLDGMLLCVLIGVVLAVAMVLASGQVVRLYTPDAEIQALAATLLLLAALYQVSDTVQVNAAGALRGYKDTRIVMLITLPAYWGVGLGVGVWLGRSTLPPGPIGVTGFWFGLLAGLSVAAVLLGWRLNRVSRDPSRVPTLVPEAR